MGGHVSIHSPYHCDLFYFLEEQGKLDPLNEEYFICIVKRWSVMVPGHDQEEVLASNDDVKMWDSSPHE